MQHSKPCLVAALLLAAGATACSESAVSPLEPGAPALATRTERDNVREPFFITLDNPCTLAVEAIYFEGIIHGMGSTWDNGHLQSHHNVTLTGVDANGVRYQGTSAGNGKVVPGGTIDDVVISTVNTSQGATDNFVTKIVLHFSADGSVQVDKLGEECRG